MTISSVSDPAKSAALRLQAGVEELLGEDLVAMWLYGGQLGPGGSAGDVDIHVIVGRDLRAEEIEQIRALHEEICRDLAIPELDAWYVLFDEARSAVRPMDLNWPVVVRDENWAIKRAHWLAGAYVLVHGLAPDRIVQRPDWSEVETELRAQIEEAVTAVEHRYPVDRTLRLCRVLRSLMTRDVVHFKLASAEWALDKVSAGSQAHVGAAIRVHRGLAEPEDRSLIERGMVAFCAEISSRAGEQPR